jgi:hypothetical protein
MSDQFINIAKPFLIQKLTDEIKLHEKEFDVVESKIDSIITQLKTQLEPISKLTIAGIKLIPFGDPTKKLEELSDELKLKMDGIDFSELENIPNIDPTLKDRIKALPDKVKTKLKDLVDELVTGKAPAAAAAATTEAAATEAELEAAAKAGLAGLDGDEKNETINKIMEMLKETGVLEEIKKRICTAAPATTAAPAGGGAKRKHRRKTKKNIRRNNNGKTRFGRTF